MEFIITAVLSASCYLGNLAYKLGKHYLDLKYGECEHCHKKRSQDDSIVCPSRSSNNQLNGLFYLLHEKHVLGAAFFCLQQLSPYARE